LNLLSIVDASFLEGLERLAFSLVIEKCPLRHWTIVTIGDVDLGLIKGRFHVEEVPLEELGPIPEPFDLGRFRIAWQKLALQKLPRQRYLYLDADLLCVGDMREMITWPHLSVVQDHGIADARKYEDGFVQFQTAVMVFVPDNEMLPEILDDPRNYLGDLGPMNDYVRKNCPEIVHYQDYKYCTHWTRHSGGEVFVHFCGPEKPWMNEKAMLYWVLSASH